MADLFGLTVSQGGLMNMLRRAEAQFTSGRDTALAALHRAKVVACDETGILIEGTNSFHWVFRCAEAVVHSSQAFLPWSVASLVRQQAYRVTFRARQCEDGFLMSLDT